MPHSLLDWLRIADTLGLALVAVRLLVGGLFRVYPAFCAHAILESVIAGASFAIPTASLLYARLFMMASPLRWALWVAIAWEMYNTALRPYKPFLTAGRWVLKVGFLAALIPIAFTISSDFSHVGPALKLLPIIFLAERTLTAVLAVLILALCAFLAWFLIPTRRNCAYICMGFGLIFAARSAAFSVRNAVGPKAAQMTNTATLATSAAVFLIWAFLLNRTGEQKTAFVGRRPSTGEAEVAIRRLHELSGPLRGTPPPRSPGAKT